MDIDGVVGTKVVALGDFSLFLVDTARAFVRVWRRRGLVFTQCEFIGVNSLGVVATAAIFLGAVLGYQLYLSFHVFGAEALVGGSVGYSLYRELGPVMTGIMVTGRAGAAMAAEIASMRVSEQIDALDIMAVDPIEYLVIPRVIAGTLMLPILAVFFSTLASIAAALVACGVMGLDGIVFWTQWAKVVDPIDLIHCVTKAAMFGFVLTSLGCFCGYRAYGGARAVGFATRSTVVASFLVILLTDYILTSFLPFGYTTLKV